MFRNTLKFLSAVGFASAMASSFAQTVSPTEDTVGQPWTGEKGITLTVDQIMKAERENPFVWDGRYRIAGPNRFEDENARAKRLDPRSPLVSSWPPKPESPLLAAAFGGGHGRNPMSPQPIGTAFDAISISEGGGYIPPDVSGDVSKTQILTVTNGRIKVFSKAGVLGALNSDMDTFFNSVRNASAVFDVHVRYDRITDRFFVIGINGATPNRVVLAVSSPGAITGAGSFTFFQFQHDLVGTTPNADTGMFADYPMVGVDANAAYIGVRDFTSPYQHTSCFVVRKSSITSGGPIVVTAFRNVTAGTTAGPDGAQGVSNDDPAATEGYFVGQDVGVFGRLVVRRISTPGGTPTMSGNLNITVPATANPLNVPAQGSTIAMESIDDRPYQAKIHKNRLTGLYTLWTAHNIGVNSAGVASAPTRTAMRWYEIGSLTTTPALVQSGTLFDSAASNFNYYWMGSCMMNGQGHMALASSFAGAANTAKIAAAGRFNTDAAGVTQPPTVVPTASATYTLDYGTGRNRWGDYTVTCIDPSDDMTMWTIQEYPIAVNTWQTRVIQLRSFPPAAVASLVPNTLTQGGTATIVVTGTSASGSGFFDTDASYTQRLAAAVSGTGVTVNSVSFIDATHFSMNVTATGAAATGARNLTVTNPDGQTSVGTGVLTITSAGNPVPTLTSLSPSSTFSKNPAFTLTVNGSNFVSGAVVRWNGSDRTTTFVNSGQVTASITAADINASGSATVTVFNPAPGGGLSNGLPFTINKRTFNGTVTLSSFGGSASTVSTTFEIRNVGSLVPLVTNTQNLGLGGSYSFQADLAPGTYDFTCKPSHWLRKKQGSIVVTSGGGATVNFTTKNGDCDGDNEVTLADYAQLAAAFGSVPGDGNWNPNADLDGDLEVTLADYAILAANFGMVGDD